MFAGVCDALEHRLAEVDAVGEHLVSRALRPWIAAAGAVGTDLKLRTFACGVQLAGNGKRRASLGERAKFTTRERNADPPALALSQRLEYVISK
jgi:hypothetical protein